MLASLITFAHLAMSALMIAPNASGASLVMSRPSCGELLAHRPACATIFDRLLMGLADDRRRRAGRRHQPEPGDRLEARQPGFGDRRQVRHDRRALQRGDRQRRAAGPACTTGRIAPMFCSVMVTRPPITSVNTAPR